MRDSEERLECSVPFHYLRSDVPLLMVPVKVNGQGPFDFILDTGNARYPFLLSPGLADEIGLDSDRFTDATDYTVGIDPTSRVGTIDLAEVAGIRVKNPCVAISPALEQLQRGMRREGASAALRIDGNIGYPFLKDYTLAFNFAESTLCLSKAPDADASIPFTLRESRPLIVLEVFACEQPLQFVLDTGASGTCLSKECARVLGLEQGREIPLNMSGDAKGFLTRLPSLRAGNSQVNDLTIVAADFLGSLSEEVGARIDGVLGHNFWGRFRLTIDYPAQKIALDAAVGGR